MFKKWLALLLTALTLVVTHAAFAKGRVTPQTPADSEIRETFGAWVERELVPYLQQDVQQKWSAKRCRQIVDKMEAAGFPIADKWKDVLYRQKREHRLYGGQAIRYLVYSQYGEIWELTVEDVAWMEEIQVAAGLRQGSLNCRPSRSDGTTSLILSAAHDALCSTFSLTEEQWNDYDISVSFSSGGTAEGTVVQYWQVMLLKDWEKDANPDYVYLFIPSTGEVEVKDTRN